MEKSKNLICHDVLLKKINFSALQMFTSTVRLQYKFKVVKDTTKIFKLPTVVYNTANIAQRYYQPL